MSNEYQALSSNNNSDIPKDRKYPVDTQIHQYFNNINIDKGTAPKILKSNNFNSIGNSS